MLIPAQDKPKSLAQLRFEESSLIYNLRLIQFEIERQVNKKIDPDTKSSDFVLVAKDEGGNDVVPKKGDLFVRFDRGMDNLAFHGEITSIESNRIGVIGRGYIGGSHYGKWWGNLLSLKHLKILNNQSK